MLGRIYFFASFGNLKEVPIGGGQTSARRLKDTLIRAGFNVLPTNRHRPKSQSGITRKLEILFWAFVDPIIFALKLLCHSRNNSLVLFIGYSGSMLPMETAIGMIAKLLGYKVVFYLKGGGAKLLYEKGSRLYRWTFRKTLKLYSLVMVEGEENGQMINQISSTTTFYLPNYAEDGFAPKELPCKDKDTVRIVYFGRIHKDKNILFIIEVFEKLCEKANNIVLSIIGTGAGDYSQSVSQRIDLSPYKDRIYRMEKQSHDGLKGILKEQHIFIFPSVEKREGHSNSLNEAMAWGVVPVVSNNNFLPSIVNDDSLVSISLDIQSYVKIIEKLINDKSLLRQKSEQVFKRVKINYTQTVIVERLIKEIGKILG